MHKNGILPSGVENSINDNDSEIGKEPKAAHQLQTHLSSKHHVQSIWISAAKPAQNMD